MWLQPRIGNIAIALLNADAIEYDKHPHYLKIPDFLLHHKNRKYRGHFAPKINIKNYSKIKSLQNGFQEKKQHLLSKSATIVVFLATWALKFSDRNSGIGTFLGQTNSIFSKKKVDFWIWLHVRHHIRKCACAIAKISAGPPMFRLWSFSSLL